MQGITKMRTQGAKKELQEILHEFPAHIGKKPRGDNKNIATGKLLHAGIVVAAQRAGRNP
jgi:hypothetical protein